MLHPSGGSDACDAGVRAMSLQGLCSMLHGSLCVGAAQCGHVLWCYGFCALPYSALCMLNWCVAVAQSAAALQCGGGTVVPDCWAVQARALHELQVPLMAATGQDSSRQSPTHISPQPQAARKLGSCIVEGTLVLLSICWLGP
jgi:hypothetical protein